MKTAFENNLDDFFYGETCVTDAPIPQRDSKEVITNISKVNKINFIPKTVAGLIPTLVCLMGMNLSAGTVLSAGAKKLYQKANSSRMLDLDDRSRSELVDSILETRERVALTQEDLAKLLNLSISTISKFERKKHDPEARNVSKYLRFVQMIDYLNDKLGGRKFAIRPLLHLESKIFDDMNAISFANSIGEEGLNEVYSQLKRLYG